MVLSLAPSSGGLLVPGGGTRLHGVDFGDEDQAPNVLTPEEIISSQELDPLIILFFGRRGDGKTLAMTTTLNIMLRAYIAKGTRYSERHPDGFKIGTNYHVQFADFNDPHLVDMLSEADERYRRMVVAVDEILSYVPSRRTMARANVNFATNCLVQIRKFDMEMLATTQKPQNIDSQMLDQIDLFIMPVLFNRRWVPERALWTHKPTGRMLRRATSVRLLIWDWWGTFTGKQYAKRWPPMLSGEEPDWILDYHGIHELFSWFHTKEPIPAMWHHKREDNLARTWADAMGDIAQEFTPEEEEEAAFTIASLDDLISAQGDEVVLHSILEEAQRLDKRIKSINDLKRAFDEKGFLIDRHSRKGWVALRTE